MKVCEETELVSVDEAISVNIVSSKYYIYILTNKSNKILYTGLMDNICRRVLEHRLKVYKGFTNRYNTDKLVYYDTFYNSDEAAKREKQIKAGSRKKKLELISKLNPNWFDLYNNLCV